METGCTVIDDLLECEITILFSFIHRPRTARAAVQQPGIVHTGRILLMRFQEIHLLLQFVFITPIVIAFTDRRILSLRPREKNAFRDEYSLRILIFSLVDRFNDVRILCLIFCDDRSRVICGRIIIYKNFIPEVRLLIHESVQCATDVFFMVICDTKNGHHYIIVHFYLPRCFNRTVAFP